MGLRVLHYADLETAFDHPERVGQLAGLIREQRDPATLVTGGGDNTAPGALSLSTHGRQALDFFGPVEPDVETFGNHDFDYGPAATARLLRDTPQTWVAANVFRDGDRFGVDAGVRPWTVADRGGERVGVVGVLSPTTPDITPAATGIEVTDPVAAVEESLENIEAADIDHVVVLSHLGADDETLARAVDVDLILGGHLHDARIERVSETVLARPGANAAGIVEAEFDGERWTARRLKADRTPPVASIVSALRDRRRATGLDEVVGTVAEPIDRSRGRTFAGESRIGNLVADAYRWATDADVGLQNAGGIREGPPLAGRVTAGDLIGVVPFDEPVTIGEVTGHELRRLFRQAAGPNAGFGDPRWWHAHLSGARVVWDDDRETITSVAVGGRPLDPDRTYSIATSDYLFETPHEFPVLSPSHRIERLGRQYEVLVEYAKATGIAPTLDGRVIRTTADGPDASSHPTKGKRRRVEEYD